MSTPESGPGAPPEGTQCPEGQIPKLQPDGTTICVPVAQEEGKDPSATGEVPSDIVASKGLTGRIELVVKEYFKQMEENFKSWMKTEFQRLKAEADAEAEEALRKSFGLEKDPVIRRSDLAKFARSAKLNSATQGKRSPASPGATGPEGNSKETAGSEQSKAVDSLLKEYGVKP